jgi:hypothetical protein
VGQEDQVRQADEPLEDDFLIVADKNPNTAAARALFPEQDDGTRAFPPISIWCWSGARASISPGCRRRPG